jgi:hypothetical protein
MWRALFCAIGIVLVILGVECLLIDTATFAAGVVDDPIPAASSFYSVPTASASRVFRPAEWMPWSFLAVGTVVLLYAMTLRRSAGEG